jgi:hypothetical protein
LRRHGPLYLTGKTDLPLRREARDEEWVALLLRRAARVFVTASHLDVAFSLDGLPIDIRLAGLDRDPGWVPAAGQFIRFHYH